jgi:hypothetical protein
MKFNNDNYDDNNDKEGKVVPMFLLKIYGGAMV